MATTTVTGTYLKPNGDPCAGRVTFQLVSAIYQETADAIYPTVTVSAPLDDDGEISVELEPTSGDDAAFTADDMTYQVREKINGAQRDAYYIDVPTSASIDLGAIQTFDDPLAVRYIPATVDLDVAGYATEAEVEAAIDAFEDNLVPLPDPGTQFKIDRVEASATTSELVLELGAEPIEDSLTVLRDGVLVDDVDLTLVTTTLTIPDPVDGEIFRLQYAYTGDTAADAGLGPGSVVASDTFTRANSTSGLGTADSGHVWENLGTSTWGITSNEAYCILAGAVPADGTPTAHPMQVIDAEISDVQVTCKLAAFSGSVGVAVRATDINNCITTNTTNIFRRETGTNNTLGSAFSATFLEGDTMRILAVGSTITVYRQTASVGAFTQVAQVTSVFNQTATKHGIRHSGTFTAPARRWDDFEITVPE